MNRIQCLDIHVYMYHHYPHVFTKKPEQEISFMASHYNFMYLSDDVNIETAELADYSRKDIFI